MGEKKITAEVAERYARFLKVTMETEEFRKRIERALDGCVTVLEAAKKAAGR